MKKNFLELQNVVPRIHDSPFKTPMNWSINEGEVWAVFGKNGSGKTRFAEVISGQYNLVQGKIIYPFFEKMKTESPEKYLQLNQFVKTISFNSVYSIADFREMYYQQRFNNTETENSALVADLFDFTEINRMETLSKALNLNKLINRRIIQLSSGELRKLLIAKVLFEKPRMIIFDNPFIGLDAASRKQLDEAFSELSKTDVQLLFLVPSIDDLPVSISHVLEINNGEIKEKMPFHREKQVLEEKTPVNWDIFPKTPETENYKTVVEMENIDISYGKQTIAKNINWKIKRGEKWVLLGANGSGKSTLLSYIFADNPQAYSKNLTLFDRRRGTGESIWDIKKRIGFTSSEMHLYYRENVSCQKVVESGFFDSIGLFRQCTEAQSQTAAYLFDILKINHLKDKLFLKISSGEQRLVLFARSLVKNPELLILDEPFHGLDDENKQRCLQIMDSFGKQPMKSLIFVTHERIENQESRVKSQDLRIKNL